MDIYGMTASQDFSFYSILTSGDLPDEFVTKILSGKTINSVHPADLDHFKKNFGADLTKTGVIYVDQTLKALYDSSGEINGFFNVTIDVTERKKKADELVQYKYIVKSSSDMLALLNKNFEYIIANKVYLEALNLSQEELLGQTPSEVFGEDFFRRKIKPNAVRCLSGEHVSYQDWFDFPGHGKVFMEINYYPCFGHDGKVKGFVMNGRNITEQNNLQEKLNQAQKMESIGQLVGGIAHDFNNLLTPILGISDLALMDIKPTDPHYSEFYDIKDTATRAAELTRQLLAFSRKKELELISVDINELIANFKMLLQSSIRENNRLEYNFAVELGRVKVDVTQVEQILMNLVVNAKDAMPDGGKIIIETDQIELDEEYVRNHTGATIGNYVQIAISDTG